MKNRLKNKSLVLGVLLIASGLVIATALFWPQLKAARNKIVAPSVSTLQNCPADNKYECYDDFFSAKTKITDPTEAFKDLRQIYDTDAYAKSQCHQLAHVIGRVAFEKYETIQAAFPKGDTFCWSGYHHGVTEKAIAVLGADKVRTSANSVCAELGRGPKQYSFEHYNCVHGLGHGFLNLEELNLFKALDTCDLLINDWERKSCYGGVYMENVMIESRGEGKSAYLRPSEPMYPCTAVEGNDRKEQCYLMQTSYALQQNGYDFAKGFDLCMRIPDTQFTSTCYQSLGRDASGSTISNVTHTRDICQKALTEDGLENCMVGAVRDFISFHHSDVQAKELCAAFGSGIQDRCLLTVKNYYKTF
jgi:hypothetical protein